MFVNKTLVEAETCYLLLEKAVLAIIHVVQRLPHYFQAHAIVVLTEHPLLRRSNFTRRIAKWGAFSELLIFSIGLGLPSKGRF